MARQRLIRPTEDTELLGETVWVGTELQKKNNLLAEGLVVKENPQIRVLLDNIGYDLPTDSSSITVTRENLWILKPR